MGMGTKWEQEKHMGRDGPERRMWEGGCEGEEKAAGLRKRMGREVV